MTGKKFYCRYVADIGPQQPMQLNMSSYKGQMGSGQVNAAAFLAAIDGAGVAMRFPNMYVDLGANVVVAPSRYFVGGEKLTYNVTITKTDIAACSMQDGKLIFKGVKEGVTSATIKASNGETHKFNITVRKGASSNGWL